MQRYCGTVLVYVMCCTKSLFSVNSVLIHRQTMTESPTAKKERMDSPLLRLLLRPESQRWLGYLGWMLQNGSLSLTVSEPETPTGLVQEPEPDITTKAPEAKHADQSALEPGADMNLIDLWSADSVPTQVPTLKPLSSLPVPSGLLKAPVPSGDLPPPMSLSDFLIPFPLVVSAIPLHSLAPLVSSSSSALPPPLALYGSSATSQASSPPLAGCTSALQAHVSTSACQPADSALALHSLISTEALGLCWAPLYIRTNLGWSSLSFRHRLPGLWLCPNPPPLWLHRAPPSLWFPCCPRLLHRRPGQLSTASPWASRPSMSPWSLDLSAPPVPPLTMVRPPWIGFWVSPSPLAKAPPWVLPPMTTSLGPSPAPCPPSSFLLSTVVA